jgi:hypothetical protein
MSTILASVQTRADRVSSLGGTVVGGGAMDRMATMSDPSISTSPFDGRTVQRFNNR